MPARSDGLPDLTLDCLGGDSTVRLAGLRGKPMLVNVWAQWCPPREIANDLAIAAHTLRHQCAGYIATGTPLAGPHAAAGPCLELIHVARAILDGPINIGASHVLTPTNDCFRGDASNRTGPQRHEARHGTTKTRGLAPLCLQLVALGSQLLGAGEAEILCTSECCQFTMESSSGGACDTRAISGYVEVFYRRAAIPVSLGDPSAQRRCIAMLRT